MKPIASKHTSYFHFARRGMRHFAAGSALFLAAGGLASVAFWIAKGTQPHLLAGFVPMAVDAGMGFLKIPPNLWNYIPRVERTVRVPPSMMLQSWMGSDFTNDDLVREASFVDDYTYTLIGEAPEADGLLDDAKDGLDRFLAQAVELLAFRRV